MYDSQSDYAINKRENDAIVYRDAFGNLTRVQRTDFTSDEEFRRFKELSDRIYHAEENTNHIETNNTVPLDGLPQSSDLIDTTQVMVMERFHRKEMIYACDEVMKIIRTRLTEVERRRLMLWCSGCTEEEIAEKEGIAQQNVSKAIQKAKAKIQSLFKGLTE